MIRIKSARPIVGGSAIKSYNAGSPAAAATDAVHAAIALTDAVQSITADITNPDVPRVATITGNAADIVGDVVVNGTNILDAVISDTLALNGTETTVGTKAFKTITSIDLPVEVHAGTDTVAVGVGDALGIPDVLTRNSVLWAFLDGTRDGTTPAVSTDADEVEKNTVLLDTALDGSAVIIDYYV